MNTEITDTTESDDSVRFVAAAKRQAEGGIIGIGFGFGRAPNLALLLRDSTTGNTVVAKPSEVTPMTAYMLSEVCREAGLPAGVLNIVHGRGAEAGAAITAHPKITTVSFTGGTVTGREVAKAAAPMFKKVGLEMGGKNPTIVFADAEMDQAIEQGVRAAFANQGQVCLCAHQ